MKLKEILSGMDFKTLDFEGEHAASKLIDIISVFHFALQDGKVTVAEAGTLVSKLISFGTELKDVYDNPSDHAKALTSDLLEIYDKLIAPMDIPFIPNFVIEPQVDRAIRAMLSSGLQAMFEGS
jgi:hypothetical protein